MLELQSNNNGRLCNQCGYIRHETDLGNKNYCPSCKTSYSSQRTTRHSNANSSLFHSCEAEKRNQQSGTRKPRALRVNTKSRYKRTESNLTAGKILTLLGVSVIGVFSAIILKSYIGF